MPGTASLRAAYTKTLYVGDLNMHALTFDLSAERKMNDIFRPYLGLGCDIVVARETSSAVNLSGENVLVPHVFGGLDLRLWQHLRLGVEVNYGDLLSEQAQIAVEF